MTMADLFPLVTEALQAFALHYQPSMQRAIGEAGLESQDWGTLFMAQGSEPQPLTAALLRQLIPYTAAATLEARLAGATGRGLLAPTRDGEYQLTEPGRRALQRSFKAVYEQLAALEPLPIDQLRRLAGLLRRVVESIQAAPMPADTSYFVSSRRTDPGEDVSLAAQLDQYLTDLSGYRDDAHMAAWRRYEVEGHAWEAFTLLWRGQADSPETLAQQLERRGHSQATYAEALGELAARGWVEEQAGGTRLTEQGQALRQQAEDETDRIFYTPWSCLNEAEIQELRGMLTQLRDNLRQLSDANTH
jgi:DNA-binding MarR family transcriptional regulator